MGRKTAAGLQDSGTPDESSAKNIKADPALFDRTHHENTAWSVILGISAAETGAWTACLIEVQGPIQGRL